MSDIQLFDNDDFGTIRAFLAEDGQPWFVAKDVAKALGYDGAAQMTRLLDEDEKGLQNVHTPGGNQQLSVITESGFYRSVMVRRSKFIKDDSTREFVVRFQRWVTHEVLPALRADGAYVAASATDDEDILIARALKAVDRRLREANAENDRLKAENRELRGKASLYDAWVDDADGLISVTRAGKLLKGMDATMGSKRLRELLRRDGYIERRSLSCTVKAIEPGYMRERLVAVPDGHGGTRAKSYGCLTAKGVGMCAMRYCGQGAMRV